jgi:predicted phosphate transport protein (TIGR00153 family)
MRLRLKPRTPVFFELFAAAGANVRAAADVAVETVGATPEQRKVLAGRMRDIEHAGDEVTHSIMEQLNRSFITPFDRDDMYRLASRIDDIIDYLDEAVDLIVCYHMEELPAGTRQQTELLAQAAQLTADAMPKLVKPQGLNEYWVEINRLENEADFVRRQILTDLFDNGTEPLEVLKAKEIVELFEEAADAFEHVADVVHTIAVKES